MGVTSLSRLLSNTSVHVHRPETLVLQQQHHKTTTKPSQHVFLYDYSSLVPGLPYLHQYGTLHPWTWDYRRTLPAIRWSPHQTHSAPPGSQTILPRSPARSAPLQRLLVTWQSCFLPVMGCQIMLSFYGKKEGINIRSTLSMASWTIFGLW